MNTPNASIDTFRSAKGRWTSRSSVVIPLLAAFVVLNSCTAHQYEEGARFRYQDEVGFAKVSVISVAPWNRVGPFLSPEFDMTADKALAAVAQVGRRQDESLSSTVSAAITGQFTPLSNLPGPPPSVSASPSASASPAASASAGASPSASASPKASSGRVTRGVAVASDELYRSIKEGQRDACHHDACVDVIRGSPRVVSES